MKYEDEELEILGIGVRWPLVVALVLATMFIFVIIEPTRQNLETRGQRQSHAYITSHQAALHTLYQQYQDPTLSLAQRRALYQQLRFEADLIPGNIPEDIQQSLRDAP